MSVLLRLTSVLAACVALGLAALPASAADLYAPSWSGQDYDEPRYGDDYSDEPRHYGRYHDRYDGESYQHSEAYEDEDGGQSYRSSAREHACVSRHEVHDRLHDQGWQDISGFEPRGRVVLVQARGRSGRLFDLTIDRCDGEVIEARPLDEHRFDDRYAHERTQRWSSY